MQADVVGPHAVQRTELAHQHKIQTLVSQRALQCGLIGRGFNDAQLAAVALRVGAGHAQRLLGQRVAQGAVLDALNRMVERTRNLQRARPVVLQQVKSHACSRFRAHARQFAKGLRQPFECIGICHNAC